MIKLESAIKFLRGRSTSETLEKSLTTFIVIYTIVLIHVLLASFILQFRVKWFKIVLIPISCAYLAIHHFILSRRFKNLSHFLLLYVFITIIVILLT